MPLSYFLYATPFSPRRFEFRRAAAAFFFRDDFSMLMPICLLPRHFSRRHVAATPLTPMPTADYARAIFAVLPPCHASHSVMLPPLMPMIVSRDTRRLTSPLRDCHEHAALFAAFDVCCFHDAVTIRCRATLMLMLILPRYDIDYDGSPVAALRPSFLPLRHAMLIRCATLRLMPRDIFRRSRCRCMPLASAPR